MSDIWWLMSVCECCGWCPLSPRYTGPGIPRCSCENEVTVLLCFLSKESLFSAFVTGVFCCCTFLNNLVCRRCDLWHHMFTKEPQSLDFLQARFVYSLMEENIKYYILCRLHCLSLINFWYDERGPAFTFIILEFLWKQWHKMSTLT